MKQWITMAEWQEIYRWLDRGLITREELARLLIRKYGHEEANHMLDCLIGVNVE